MVDALLVVYSVAEICLSMVISTSNFVVIIAYLRARHIRRTAANAYIFSLAITDFLAGSVGIPLTVTSVLTGWPFSFFPCLAIHLILCMLCTISTFHLLSMAVHKYLSICQKKFGFQRSTTIRSIRMRRVNLVIIGSWTFGAFLGGLPLMDGFGFATKTMDNFKGECHFTDVVDYRYLVFIIFFGTIVLPSVIIAFCYTSIYSYIRQEERPIHCHLQAAERQRRNNSNRKMLRILIILVTTFALCWYPLYIINTLDLFFNLNAGRTATLMAVVLSHANCALNPVIYAYGVPGFKQSLRRYFPFFSPVSNISMQQGCTGGGGGAACGVPLPGINAHAAWYNNLAAAKHGSSSCAVGIGTDRRRSMAQFNTGTTNQQLIGGGRRTVSTVNHHLAAFPYAMALGGSQRVAQFRRHHSVLQQPPQLQQNSTETEESAADEILDIVPQQQMSSDNSFGTNCSSNADKRIEECCPTDPSESDRKRSGQSIASRVSVWSLRIFSGQWRVLRRRTSSAQSLKESGTMLVENRNEEGSSIGKTITKKWNRSLFNSEERKKLRSDEGKREVKSVQVD